MVELFSTTSGRPASLTMPWATSIRKPATPRSSQKRSTDSNSSMTFGLSQLKSGCEESKMCRYHWPSSIWVQAGPPNTDSQLFGGSSPFLPVPSRNMYISRSLEPLPAASAAWNSGCWSEEWFGTRSTITRMPIEVALANITSKSARVPNSGSMSL